MNCPRCEHEPLAERDRDGVTVDVCARCRGVWLDRGELEKLIARSQSDYDRHDYEPPSSRPGYRGPGYGDRPGSSGHGAGAPPRRKKSWLETLGDVFD